MKNSHTQSGRFQYPKMNELIAKAERTTNSCLFLEQVDVSKRFYQDVVLRGVRDNVYSENEFQKASLLLDYIASQKTRTLVQNLMVV